MDENLWFGVAFTQEGADAEDVDERPCDGLSFCGMGLFLVGSCPKWVGLL